MNKFKDSERGSAKVKFAVVIVIVYLLAYAGYNYVPVAYEGESFKQEMQTAVVSGSVIVSSNKTAVDAVKEKLMRQVKLYDLPNPFIEIKPVNSTVQARVAYTKKVPLLPFGLYTKTYVFDETVTPVGFLNKSL